jgi:hypothetical protein
MQKELVYEPIIGCKKIPRGCLFSNGVEANEAAFTIYSLCDGRQPAKAIYDQLQAKYRAGNESDRRMIWRDTHSCLQEMEKYGIVKKIA